METKLNSDHSHTLWASWRAPDSEEAFPAFPSNGTSDRQKLGNCTKEGGGGVLHSLLLSVLALEDTRLFLSAFKGAGN